MQLRLPFLVDFGWGFLAAIGWMRGSEPEERREGGSWLEAEGEELVVVELELLGRW